MMEGFTRSEIKTSGATIVTVHGGKGPPLLLMHGWPSSVWEFHRLIPLLRQSARVVVPSLPGTDSPAGGAPRSRRWRTRCTA